MCQEALRTPKPYLRAPAVPSQCSLHPSEAYELQSHAPGRPTKPSDTDSSGKPLTFFLGEGMAFGPLGHRDERCALRSASHGLGHCARTPSPTSHTLLGVSNHAIARIRVCRTQRQSTWRKWRAAIPSTHRASLVQWFTHCGGKPDAPTVGGLVNANATAGGVNGAALRHPVCHPLRHERRPNLKKWAAQI